ncbi:TetR/AcrR family transcriptional regulator [Bradyrhizobium sp.]|uniref:TetR/AcrR family transcriptional regulator n=1 Tax=Bradyrhizobium sp. TaxID=376 RepID=UPI0025BA7845|nr:TetR/AcrR family transcriptional regulator [Bradyrhizobium sp.]
MARSYTLKKRAEQQAETRNRIVEAAVDLHSTLGPARTTFSMVAEKAGVQRHTLYAHFPDELALAMACSGHVYMLDPLPDAAAWSGITGTSERLGAGLTAVYGWYGRHASLMTCLVRDVEHHATTREVVSLRVAPVVVGWHEVLGANLDAKQRAMLQLALSFHTWRTLVQEAGLKEAAAVNAMVQAIEAVQET